MDTVRAVFRKDEYDEYLPYYITCIRAIFARDIGVVLVKCMIVHEQVTLPINN